METSCSLSSQEGKIMLLINIQIRIHPVTQFKYSHPMILWICFYLDTLKFVKKERRHG